MKEHNMKRTVVLLATLLLSFGLTNAANLVDVGMNADTAFSGQQRAFVISIENDALLGGISLGWYIYSPDGATFTLDNAPGSQFAGATPNGSTPFLGVGARWMSGAASDGSCWDLGGTLVNDQLAPAQILVGGAALGGGLAAGPLEPQLELYFTADGAGEDEFLTICIDSLFYPPAGQFIFDPGGTPASNLPACFPVTQQKDPCPVWDGGLPTAMVVNHCENGQVTVSATDPEPNAGTVFYYLAGNTGAGTATVGETSGLVTYTPDNADVGNPVQLTIEATDAVHQEGGCTGDLWTIDVTVTNTAPVIDCGKALEFVGQGNTLTKTDIAATDDDVCDVLVYSIVDVTPAPVGTYSIDPSTGVVTFNTDNPGDGGNTYTFTIGVDDGFGVVSCTFDVTVLTVEPWMVGIEKIHQAIQGHFIDVPVRIIKGSEPFGGFDFLIGYDASALAFTEASLGSFWVNCGWEYFTYRYNWNGNCGNACPSGLLRVIGIAETNNGPNHPDYGCMDQWTPGEDCYDNTSTILFNLTFYLSNDRTLECQFAPVRFYWFDCGDNTMSTIGGDTLAINRFIYDIGSCQYTEMQDYTFGFPGYYGAPDIPCLEGDKDAPVRFLDLCNGGVDIICADSIDARGDINVNGVVYEIADAVMFTNYFLSGLSAFGDHVEASIAASDVNADGIALSVADLVYLVRVIVGDANPYPKPQPGAYATLTQQGDIVRMDASLDIGAVLMVFEGTGTPELNVDMDMKYSQSGDELRVLIYDIGKRGIDAGESTLLTVSGATLVDAEVASYEGFTVEHMIDVKPTEYALQQNSPNPFNPTTTIAFKMPVEADWTIEVFNVAGQLVRDYAGHSQAGTVEVVWDGMDNSGKSVASGIYFYRARTDQFSETKKMVLMK
jgi:hypothetical protein